MVKNNNITYVLASISLISLALAIFIPALAPLSFIGLAPLFQIYEKGKTRVGVIHVFVILLIIYILWSLHHSISVWYMPMLYAVAMSLSLIIFSFTDRYAKNRIGLFTIIIYWLAFEFIMLEIDNRYAIYLLGNIFGSQPELMSWNAYTGLIGASMWILTINILIYYAVFRKNRFLDKRIHWPGLLLTITLIVLSLLIQPDTPAIEAHDLIQGNSALKQRAGNGEYIGKTAVWVSALLILYGFVKREINRDGRT